MTPNQNSEVDEARAKILMTTDGSSEAEAFLAEALDFKPQNNSEVDELEHLTKYGICLEWKKLKGSSYGELLRYLKPIQAHYARQQERAVREALSIPNQLLRSAYQIAKRNGEETNWSAWISQLESELKREHRLMYPEVALTNPTNQ